MQGVAELKEQGILAWEKQIGLNNETILPKNRETRVLINFSYFSGRLGALNDIYSKKYRYVF